LDALHLGRIKFHAPLPAAGLLTVHAVSAQELSAAERRKGSVTDGIKEMRAAKKSENTHKTVVIPGGIYYNVNRVRVQSAR